MRVRKLFLVIATLFTFIAGVKQASAIYVLPPGIYFIRCDGVYPHVYDITGRNLGRLDGYLCIGLWTCKVTVYDALQRPQPPEQDPKDAEAWQGMDAQKWTETIKMTYQAAEGDNVDPKDFGDQEKLPNLACNTNDLDPDPTPPLGMIGNGSGHSYGVGVLMAGRLGAAATR
ncbi:MAG TPA: hypothetical protein VHI13_17775 [Candidatus Kapabacteria bacterium]|nr:hypothetical protein [Candidatus Kapabacteria bacterium]